MIKINLKKLLQNLQRLITSEQKVKSSSTEASILKNIKKDESN
jgi:hypothetical protein